MRAGSRRLRVGAFADVVVFDAATIKDVVTFEAPKAQAVRVDCVLVNGRLAHRAGASEPNGYGRFLRRRLPGDLCAHEQPAAQQ